ncbi:BrnT family toxin [candidate division KSB1 bacterium]|nr:BrnT family toxin [candidate division KSB1 bacterium]
MKDNVYSWSEEKNQRLKTERNVSFEDVVAHVMAGDLLDVVDHPNSEKYPGQQVLIVKMRDYAWLVPYVQEGNEAFLKTIIPSRKATKKYLGEKHAKL